MKIYNVFFRFVLLSTVFTNFMTVGFAQSGDQILDGIGETGLIARYVLNGDLRDWSRNSLHASHPAGAKFESDARYGSVLSISGGKDDYVELPIDILNDMESLAISTWVNVRSDKPGQYLFDFGDGNLNRFFAVPMGSDKGSGFQSVITAGEKDEKGAVSPAIPTNKWVHLAIVVDIPSKVIRSYVDSKEVARFHDIPSDLSEVFGQSKESNRLIIGKSLTGEMSNINALVRDFRIYRIPITENQIQDIYNNATGRRRSSVNVRPSEGELPNFPLSQAQLYNQYLLAVSDVEVETEVGELPRLPSFLEGTYKEGLIGPKVRVIWPTPNDNSTVVSAGKYVITGRVPGTDLEPKATVLVKSNKKSNTPSATLQAFALSDVSLNFDSHNQETKFIENRDKFIKTLAATDPNSFLYMFRDAFGQPQPAGAKPLGVWDSQDTKLRGHATGHYLTAIAQAYASVGYDETLKQNFAGKMSYMVDVLYELSQLAGKPKGSEGEYNSDPNNVSYGPGKEGYDSDLSKEGMRTDYWNWGLGYISAYPPDQFIMLEQGAKYGGQNNQVWAPYYTLHKILAGLIDIYEINGNEKALTVAKGMADWVYARLSQLPKETLVDIWNTYIAGEFGGMNETMAHLYRITGKSDYLKTAQLFDNIDMFFGDVELTHGLAKNVDTFRGLHANQHIPQVVGSIVMYDVSNLPEYYKVADNFWYKAVNDYMYSIGGVAGARNPANAEVFTAEPATLYENGFASGGQNETCATYNLLKLTGNLFLFDQRAEYMDYYERGLYNHILASVAENTPANTYHVPLNPGAIKQFGNPSMTGFTCCNGTAIESSTKLQNAIYFKSKDNKAVYVNLYVPSTLHWNERELIITQNTSFPKQDYTELSIDGHGKFDIHLRVPGWATKGFFVTINGKEQKIDAKPGTYLKLTRNWKNGDKIGLRMPFQFRLDPVMDQQNVASLFYGPVLLAAQETEATKDWRKVTLDAKDLSKSIQGNPSTLEFEINGVKFKPFYDTYGRHSVYLDVTLE